MIADGKHCFLAINLHDILVVKMMGLNYTILIKFEKQQK